MPATSAVMTWPRRLKSCWEIEYCKLKVATLDFIRVHANDDVRQLALRSAPPEVDIRVALQQIEGRQLAAAKAPKLATTDGILYPPRLSMEQCSSEATAAYKRDIIARLLNSLPSTEGERTESASFIDFTGGFGIDFMAIAPLFKRAVYVERNADLCDIARHNLPLMGCQHAEVLCEEVTPDSSLFSHHFSCCLIDPARRDSAGRKVALIEDCTPDVCALQEQLRARAHYTLIKLSPMLDIAAAVRALRCIQAVHVVSVAGECKELLLVMGQQEIPADEIPIHCVDLKGNSSEFIFTRQEEMTTPARFYPPSIPEAGYYIYEPHASILKAGVFKSICQRFPVQKLAPNAHLYVSDKLLEEFPGRKWIVMDAATFNKKELRRLLCGIEEAELTVRGFPLSVAALRKQLHLREGGTVHFIATSLANNTKLLLKVQTVNCEL